MGKLRKFKRALIISLVFMLAFSSGIFGAVSARAESATSQDYEKFRKSSGEAAQPTEHYDENEEVRVIVELEGDPAILFATKKGLRYKDLSLSQKEQLQTEIKVEQTDFLTDLNSKSIDLQIENTFTTVANGVSGIMKFGDIEELKKIPAVSSVHIANRYERPEEKPQMVTSKDQVGAKQTWDLGYNGNGTVVAIIDTGIDPSHKDMVLSKETAPKLTEAKVKEAATAHNLPGKYFTAKVPYGYNYADKNSNILDLGSDASMHGMHVAGTVGANGDEQNGGLQGVAPEAQLLAMKVFGNDSEMASTFGDIYIKAIDDAIKLGADVMNMSLGSTASFVSADSPEQQAVKRAVDNGVLMAISAGNSARFGEGYYYPYASNPDIGVVGAPGLTSDSLQVASIENSHIQLDEMDIAVGEEILHIAYKRQSTPMPLDVFGKNQKDVVYVADGQPDKYEGKNVTGKLVFVVRTGGFNYGMIQKQAEAAGAVGVIVRGHESHGDYVSMALNSPIIPMVTLSLADGNTLEDKFKAAENAGKVTFTGKTKAVVNASQGKMSAFTSWGTTPNLDFKPEITAPGGQIYSTLNDNQYGLMSGTSMAAPHVAGGSALVLQRVSEAFPNLTGSAKVKMAKNILMNTSVPVKEPEADLYSPRRQGAGIMQLPSAVTTPVYVTEKTTGEAKVVLKEIKSDEFTFTLTATNFGNKPAKYMVDTTVLTDFVTEGYNLLTSRVIKDAAFHVPEITVPAGGSKDFIITIDLSNAKAELERLMENGYFVEGFVQLLNISEDDTISNLSVPFIGFKGDWNAPPILDDMVYNPDSYFGDSGLVNEKNAYLGKNPYTGEFDANTVSFSPNGDGINDKLAPKLTFLRNSKTVEYSIVDSTGKQLRKLRTDSNQRKNYYDSGRALWYTLKPSLTAWDGLVSNKPAADGTYFYQVKATIDYPGKEAQVYQFPVILDTESPEVLDAKFDSDLNKLTFKANDLKGSGVAYVAIVVDGKLESYIAPEAASVVYSFKKMVPVGANIDIVAFDYAGNYGYSSIEGAGDNTIPYITATSPEALGVYSTNVVPVSGYVNDSSDMDHLTLTGDKVEGSPVRIPLIWNAKEKRYDFSTQIRFTEDGAHDIYVAGTDSAGNNIEFRRQVFIDTEAPTIELVGLPANGYVSEEVNELTVTAKIGDNFDEMRLLLNGSEEYTHSFAQPYIMRALNAEVPLNLVLEHGKNEFVLEAEDIAGTVTTKVFTIYKGVEAPVGHITSLTVQPGLEVSKNRPALITAEANVEVDWDVTITNPSGQTITLPAASGKTFEGTFVPDELTINGEYKVTAIASVNGNVAEEKEVTFTVYNYPLQVQTVELMDGQGNLATTFKQNEKVKIKANVRNLGPNSESPLVIIQVKDQEGVVVSVHFLTVDELANGARNGFGVELSLKNYKKGSYSVEVYVWDSWTNPSSLAEAKKDSAVFIVE
ncbi:S8 family serine peptidase [Neobacillus sp. YIM B06451]|uniref:S8 family serine peptidase n=1 Tax=Neobacillus sp. YIM B06451 TaxID=3070994 RepID=UPI00292F22A3|nr:S8 family serine peptidase [Neobacillus sp. YIM B06451]